MNKLIEIRQKIRSAKNIEELDEICKKIDLRGHDVQKMMKEECPIKKQELMDKRNKKFKLFSSISTVILAVIAVLTYMFK